MKKLLVIGICFLSSPIMASWTIKSSQFACANGGSSNPSLTLSTTGADFIVCAVSAFNVIPSGTVADLVGGNSNSWTCKTGQFKSPNGGTKLCYAANPSFLGSDVIHYNSGTGEFSGLVCASFSGSKTSADPFDAENGTTFTLQTSVSAGSITPGSADDLFVTSIATDGASQDASTVSGWALPANGRQVYSSGNCESSQLWYLAPGTSSAQNPAWSWVSSNSGGVVDAAFLPAPAGGASVANAPFLGTEF